MLRLCLGVAVIFLLLSSFIAHSEDEEVIDAQAEKILKTMIDYRNQLKAFSFHADNMVDDMLDSGLKLQYSRSVDAFIRRPGRIRANVNGDLIHQKFFYDGKTITLYDGDHNVYATIDAPSDISSALRHAVQAFDLHAPLADLFAKTSYEELTTGVLQGSYVGLHDVLGTKCHHLVFRQRDVDWQIWIDAGSKPLPRKYIVTQKWVTGAPQFTALLSNWNTSARLKDNLFKFVPPKKAEQIEFMPASGVRR